MDKGSTGKGGGDGESICSEVIWEGGIGVNDYDDADTDNLFFEGYVQVMAT